VSAAQSQVAQTSAAAFGLSHVARAHHGSLLDFDLLWVAVMREDRPSISGPHPCSRCCFRPEGIQHALVNLPV
jgi:hypothetical protein